MRNYIAYGSNLNVGQMRWRCPGAKVLGQGVIEDYQLMYKGSHTGAYLTIEPRKGAKVPVVVWSVTAADETRLDAYEGCPTFYYKTDMSIEIDGKKVDAFVYIMHEDRLHGRPSEYYVDVCREGYEHFGLDTQILDEAYWYTMERVYEDEYEIIYDYEGASGDTDRNCVETFTGSWSELQDYIDDMRKCGCYNIDATCISG